MRLIIVLVSCTLAGVSIAQDVDIHGNCNAVGNGNIVCSAVRSDFSEELGDQLIKSMPDKKKVVSLNTVGGAKDQKVGDQIHQFLIQHGYSVQRSIIGMLVPPPDQFITLPGPYAPAGARLAFNSQYQQNHEHRQPANNYNANKPRTSNLIAIGHSKKLKRKVTLHLKPELVLCIVRI